MAFRITEVAVRLSGPNGPAECSCTVETRITGGACPFPSVRDDKGRANAGPLSTLRLQLRQTLSRV